MEDTICWRCREQSSVGGELGSGNGGRERGWMDGNTTKTKNLPHPLPGQVHMPAFYHPIKRFVTLSENSATGQSPAPESRAE